MTANDDLQRRLTNHYRGEPPMRAPDWVLQSALSTIESIPQRRGVAALRRYPSMSTYTKLAAAAVVVVAVGALALWQLGPGGPGGQPTPAPTATTVPTASAPIAGLGVYVSQINGISIDTTERWDAEPATQAWAPGTELPWNLGSPAADFLFEGPTRDIFLGLASQPLGAESATDWIDRMLAIADPEPCPETEAVEVDGAQGRLATCDEPLRAFVTDAQRGYAIFLYRSDEAPQDRYDVEFFKSLLSTVQLRPGDARD